VHQSPSVTNEEQELLALVFLFRPAEKNKPVESILLEQEEQRSKKSTIEEVFFFSVCYDGQVQTCKEIK